MEWGAGKGERRQPTWRCMTACRADSMCATRLCSASDFCATHCSDSMCAERICVICMTGSSASASSPPMTAEGEDFRVEGGMEREGSSQDKHQTAVEAHNHILEVHAHGFKLAIDVLGKLEAVCLGVCGDGRQDDTSGWDGW